jgi:hypothetical protein
MFLCALGLLLVASALTTASTSLFSPSPAHHPCLESPLLAQFPGPFSIKTTFFMAFFGNQSSLNTLSTSTAPQHHLANESHVPLTWWHNE